MKYFLPEEIEELMDFLPAWIHALATGEVQSAFEDVDPGEFTPTSLFDAIEKHAGSRNLTSPFDAPDPPEGMRESLEGETDDVVGIAHPELPYGLVIEKEESADSIGYATLQLPVDDEWTGAVIEFDIADHEDGWYFVINSVAS